MEKGNRRGKRAEFVSCGDGEIGALLRHEGSYSSLLAAWRRAFAEHGESGLAAKRRGPAPKAKPSARD